LEAYKTFIGISTGLIPPKKGRGKGAQGTKATVIPKKATSASKKKKQNKKVSNRDESSDEESGISAPVAQVKELVRPNISDSDEGARDEKIEDIPWKSTYDDESEDDDEEDESDDDKNIDIEKTDDERTDKIREKTPPSLGHSSSQGQSAIQAAESLSEYELKKILYEKMHKSKSHLTHDTHQELYDALMWSMLLDEATTKEGDNPNKVLKKRDSGDDQDEDPSVGSNQGKKTKKRRVSESESSKKTSTTKESSKGESMARTSKSGKFVTAKESVEEPVFEIVLDDVEQIVDDKVGDVGQPPHTDADETQADVAPRISKKDYTPIDFSAFAMNRLKLNKITRVDLVGPVFNLLKGTYKSCVELEYNMEECYDALTDQLDWANPEERTYSSSITKTPAARYTMEGIEDMIPTLWSPIIISYDKDATLGISHWTTTSTRSGYGYLKEIIVRRAHQKLYKFKEGDFPNLHLNDIEDMLLLIAQNKLFNLDGDVIVDFVTALKMLGIIVKNRVEDVQPDKSKKKRLMRVDEIHKFSDGTLQSVRKILRERLLNFKFGYNKDMPLREWKTKDKKRTCIMLNKIDDLMFKRRVLRSLEVVVGGRKTESDK
ncbi:hypothetical protein Tco_0963477, partial [Tanacetum coccineum]